MHACTPTVISKIDFCAYTHIFCTPLPKILDPSLHCFVICIYLYGCQCRCGVCALLSTLDTYDCKCIILTLKSSPENYTVKYRAERVKEKKLLMQKRPAESKLYGPIFAERKCDTQHEIHSSCNTTISLFNVLY